MLDAQMQHLAGAAGMGSRFRPKRDILHPVALLRSKPAYRPFAVGAKLEDRRTHPLRNFPDTCPARANGVSLLLDERRHIIAQYFDSSHWFFFFVLDRAQQLLLHGQQTSFYMRGGKIRLGSALQICLCISDCLRSERLVDEIFNHVEACSPVSIRWV